MPLQLTASASSAHRIRKPGLKRATSSPFSSSKRKKPGTSSTTPTSVQRTKSAPSTSEAQDSSYIVKLPDRGVLPILPTSTSPSPSSSLADQIRSILDHQWTPIPTSGAGMNSTRIAEILNFRRKIPPLVSLHHIHALRNSPTSTEREIELLVRQGTIRRINLPARELGAGAVDEALVLVSDWIQHITSNPDLPADLKGKYITLLNSPQSEQEQGTTLTPPDLAALIRTGYILPSNSLTPTSSSHQAALYLTPSASTLGTLPHVSTAGSTHAAGTPGAVATPNVEHIAGGSGFTRRIGSTSTSTLPSSSSSSGSQNYTLTLPNTGPYLKLLHTSRAHLLSLLTRSNKYRELPLSVLRERWDGGVAGTDEATRAQRLRGEWRGVVPGKTRKWRGFSGLEFGWCLGECVGAGVVECFATGMGEVGVRGL